MCTFMQVQVRLTLHHYICVFEMFSTLWRLINFVINLGFTLNISRKSFFLNNINTVFSLQNAWQCMHTGSHYTHDNFEPYMAFKVINHMHQWSHTVCNMCCTGYAIFSLLLQITHNLMENEVQLACLVIERHVTLLHSAVVVFPYYLH